MKSDAKAKKANPKGRDENPKREKNPRNNHSGLGAFIGSAIGATPAVVMSVRGDGVTARNFAIAELGWIVGGAAGGAIGAKKDRRKRAAIGGAIGGLFGPLGAALGGYIGGQKPDRKANPGMWVVPVAVVGAAAVAAGGLFLYRRRKRKELEPGPVVEPPGTEEPETELDDWGFPAWDIRVEESTVSSVPYRIYQSATEGTFYGAWQTDSGVQSLNSPYGAAALPWGIEETKTRTVAAIGAR